MKSIATAFTIAFLVLVFSVGVVAPHMMSQIVGTPDERIAKHVSLAAADRLELDNSDGSVVVTPSATDEIRVDVDARVFGRTDEAVSRARSYVQELVQIVEQGNTARIVTEPGERPNGIELHVVYTISVPEGTDLDIRCQNGNVRIGAGAGSVTVNGHNTDISISKPMRTVVANSVNGRINVQDAPADTALQTVNGNVQVAMKGGFLEATTANGMINARVLENGFEGCALLNQNGSIRVTLPESSDLAIEARTTRGFVFSQLPFASASDASQRRYLSGTIGDSSPKAQVKMDTSNGNIFISGVAR